MLNAFQRSTFTAFDGTERHFHAFQGGFEQGDQRPDCGNTDGAGADKAHFFFPQPHGESNHFHIGRLRIGGREIGDSDAPGDRNTYQHGNTAGQADQIAGAEQSQ